MNEMNTVVPEELMKLILKESVITSTFKDGRIYDISFTYQNEFQLHLFTMDREIDVTNIDMSKSLVLVNKYKESFAFLSTFLKADRDPIQLNNDDNNKWTFIDYTEDEKKDMGWDFSLSILSDDNTHFIAINYKETSSLYLLSLFISLFILQDKTVIEETIRVLKENSLSSL